ncbi:DUF4062 domain-containing protein [Paenibacillus woosongensis]|uniref:DUF4062 domain-containing protein n=1 Tax=Paenibacillus woosongensis TaxID=307580 RepID=A0AA95I506_9BACL|nr:DUF4062 domain-containing protein [Paenibacillus woosongensis]WHX49581.1 DUF4062 domain-containing protein [Paenibacillus woosongensis]
MDKRYQVFVSSTYQDLQEERQEVMQALLELDCIPSGMELFPAANDDQWTLIKKVIDDSDYYMVIIGGRYGSIGPDGLSFTEMEYRYAVSCGKPVIAFLHKNPGELSANRTEKDPDSITKLNDFRKMAEMKLVKYWTTPFDLGSMVSRSLIRLIKTNPAIGWVRADQVPDENSSKEILRLRKQVEDLEKSLAEARTQAPQGSENLAQGTDEVELEYSFVTKDPKTYKRIRYKSDFITTWNELFSRLAPFMIDESDEQRLLIAINDYISESERGELKQEDDFKGKVLESFEINESNFQTILIQFRALGLIIKSNRQRSLRDKGTYWSLTPYGDEIITQIRAIRKE